MPSISLDTADAIELAETLQLIARWLAADPERLAASLLGFIGHPAYAPDALRADLDRFTFLLGGNDGEFLLGEDPPWRRCPGSGEPALSHRSRRRYQDSLRCSRHDEPMTADWTHELFNQFDLQWNLAHGPSLETLTDEEYLWEPVPGCWSIRPTGPAGRGEFEQAWPDPEPAPVTTIAWRLSHLAVGVFGLRASHYFGDGSLTHDNAERPLTAKEGVAYFKEQALQWRSHTERLDEEGLARPVGEPEHAPVLSLVVHVNREALHHLAEVSLLRDLYRATGGARLA